MAPVKAMLEVIMGINKGLKVTADFNPQSLGLDYYASGFSGSVADTQQLEKQEATAQGTGFGSTLSLELLFDTSQSGQDVQNTTLKIAKMMQPEEQKTSNTNEAPPLPLVRFSWGTFLFYGNIKSMNETLDFFSEQGVPVRSTVRLSINEVAPDGGTTRVQGAGGAGAAAGPTPAPAVGTTPLTAIRAGDTIQNLAARAGIASSAWKAIASANNIDNPRRMQPSTVVNLNAGLS